MNQKEWYQNNRDKVLENSRRYYQKHKIKCNETTKKYYQKNKEKCKKREKERRKENKIKVFAAYGGAKCNICGNIDFDVLVVDHIKGGGCKHRRSFSSYAGQVIYNWLIKNNFPEGFRILCRNCDWKERLKKINLS